MSHFLPRALATPVCPYHTYPPRAAKAKAKVPGYLNTAACHIKLQNWKECAAVCEKALKIDSRNVKALYRLSQALLELAELSDAVLCPSSLSSVQCFFQKRQVDKLLEIDPANADAAKLLAKIKRLQSAQDQKDKKLFAGPALLLRFASAQPHSPPRSQPCSNNKVVPVPHTYQTFYTEFSHNWLFVINRFPSLPPRMLGTCFLAVRRAFGNRTTFCRNEIWALVVAELRRLSSL